jgi:translocation and assembly module TamB
MFTNIDSSLKATKGTVSYLRTPFKISTASAAWPENGVVVPNIIVVASAKFKSYNIDMKLTGPLTEMDLQLTSDPSLSKAQIVRMLTLQREAAGSDDISSADLQNLMTAGLQMSIFGGVEQIFKDTLGLDQFQIYSGRLISGVEVTKSNISDLSVEERNQYNVLTSKYLTDKLMLGYTTSMDGVHHSVFAQYDLNRHLNVGYAIDEKNKNLYTVTYTISF